MQKKVTQLHEHALDEKAEHAHKVGHGQKSQHEKYGHGLTTSLFSGHVGAAGHVANIKTHNNREAGKLMALGVLPGVPIRLMRKFPSFVFQLGYSQFTVDETLAKKIQVKWK